MDDLFNIFVRGEKIDANGNRAPEMIPLATLIDIQREYKPSNIERYNKMRSVTLTPRLAKGVSMGDAVDFVLSNVKKDLPENVTLELDGEPKVFLESKGTIYFIFALSILFIYLVMSAQFESFRDPIIIMFSVPLSLAGAVYTIWATGGTLNIFSQIGFVTLIGLITKHGILMVDFANQKLQNGLSSTESIVSAAKMRLRPILMTTAAMVLGAVPLAFSSGAGSEGSREIGWVIVGGMSIGTLFTLFVLPVVYIVFSKKKNLLTDKDLEV